MKTVYLFCVIKGVVWGQNGIKLYNKNWVKFYNFSTPHKKRMSWEEYLAFIEDRRVAYRVLVVRPEGKNYLEDLGVDGRIILKKILKKFNEEECTGLI